MTGEMHLYSFRHSACIVQEFKEESTMLKKTEDLLKKFEQENEVYLEARDQKSYWEVTARMPKKIDSLHHLHRAKRYITGREQEGNVLIIQNPEVYESYTVEQWGGFATFDDFVGLVLEAVKQDIIDYENSCKEGDEVQAPTDLRAT